MTSPNRKLTSSGRQKHCTNLENLGGRTLASEAIGKGKRGWGWRRGVCGIGGRGFVCDWHRGGGGTRGWGGEGG